MPSDLRPASALRSVSEADLLVQWSGDPQWLVGYDIGGEAFGGGLVRGRYLVGSTIGPDDDVPVEIVFSSEEETLLQAFTAGEDQFPPNGVGTFPGAAYDTSDPDNPRRLNICLLELGITGAPNRTWDPDTSPPGGGELLFVMASDYDGTGLTYADADLALPPAEDVLYVLWGRVPTGRTLLEADPSSLTIDLARIDLAASLPENGEVDLAWAYDAAPEATALRVYTGIGEANDLLAELPITATTYTHLVAENELRSYRLEAVDADGGIVDVSTEVTVQTFVSMNASLVGVVDPRGDYGDVWGYVDPATDEEYALLTARFDGLSIVGVDALEEIAFVPGLTDGDGIVADAKDVKTYGPYAYVAHEIAPIQIIDLTDIENPVEVGRLDVQPDASDGGSHNILVEGDYLYVVGGRSPGGLRIYSLADAPTAPALVGEINGDDGETYYHDLDVVGDVAYAAAIYDDGIDVLDLSDRANPSVITTSIYPATSMGAHNVCTSEDGGTVFVGDEIGSGTWTRVFDVSDLSDVDQIAEIIVDENAAVHNCYVTGDLLHVAHYTEGYQVFDVSDPASPQRVAFYDTYPQPGYGFEGAWTAYPFLPSRRTLVSTLGEGLFVVRLDGSVVASVAPATAAAFTLEAPYPNPTAGAATLGYTLAGAARVRVTLFDALGRTVTVLAEGERAAGTHTAAVATDGLANGIYFVRLDADGQRMTRPLTVQR